MLKHLPGSIAEFVADGRTVRFFVTNPNDSVMKYHHDGGFYEREELAIIARYCAGGTLVDVGANVGNHAVYLSKFTSASRIVAFEPNPEAIDILRVNLLLNECRNVDTQFLGVALGAREGRLRSSTPDADNLGNTMFFEDASGATLMLPGDALLLDQPIEFIKLDVEGMEMEILAGLSQTIRRWRPTMFVEVWESGADVFAAWCRAESYRVVETYQRYDAITNYLVRWESA